MGGGLSTRAYRKLVAEQRAKREPCCICGEPIDYGLPDTHRLSYTTAHDVPVAHRPDLAEQASNIKGAAHRLCNSAEGARAYAPPSPLALGTTSGGW